MIGGIPKLLRKYLQQRVDAKKKTKSSRGKVRNSSRTEDISSHKASKVSLLDLPNELLSKVFEQLDSSDRKSFASVHSRLNGVEKKTGYRRFNTISFGPESFRIDAFDIRKDDFNIIAIKEVVEFFKNAKVKRLLFKSVLDEETTNRLVIAFGTMQVENLDLCFSSENNGRLVYKLVHESNFSFGAAQIRCGTDGGTMRLSNGKQVLMRLPHMRHCSIEIANNSVVIDDDIFLHILNHSKYVEFIGVTTNVSALGLAQAFKIVCGSKYGKIAKCLVHKSAIAEFVRQYGRNLQDSCRIEDRDSMGCISYTLKFDSIYRVSLYHQLLRF